MKPIENAEAKIQEICEKKNIPTPIEFLTEIMGGTDPRRVSLVYKLVCQLEETYGESAPDEWDWLVLVDLIKTEYRGSIVELSKSQDAAKQLIEYQHPKRKSVEHKNVAASLETSPLSNKEIRAIRRRFDLEF